MALFGGKEKLDIVIPVYNEEECLDELMKRLIALKDRLHQYETNLIFVDDGSKDRTAAMLLKYADQHKYVKVISLSRNFGHQFAITAGMDHANGDYNVIIDGDLQDPPEVIDEMLKKAKEGYDVVYGTRLSRKGETIFKKLTASMFYRFISWMCDINIPADTGDFRLISKRVLEQLKTMKEKHRFIRGMVPWVGFKGTPVHYHRDERYAGKSKYTLRHMIRFALNSIFSFSNIPLKMASYIGSLIVFVGVIIGLMLVYFRLYTGYSVPGITTVFLAVIIIGGIQIIMIGIMGEYVGRIFEETKNRPLYVVWEKKNIE